MQQKEENWVTVMKKNKGKAKRQEKNEALQAQYHDYLRGHEDAQTCSDVSDDEGQTALANIAPNSKADGDEMRITSHKAPGDDTAADSLAVTETAPDPNPSTRKFRSPWMRKAFMFHDEPNFTKEDLIIPHYKDVNLKGNTLFLEDSDFVPIQDGWGICLLGIFAGRFPGKEAVHQLMNRWPTKAKVSFHRKGWMLFQFASEHDRELTRQKGPFAQYGIPLILQPVPDNFRLSMEPEINIPVWVRLTDLELYFWHEEMVGKIASCIGTPIAVDFPSLQKKGLDWPRVQVIIDASKPPLHELKLEARNGDVFNQKFDFEYLPKFCRKCKVFGHYGEGCAGPENRGRQLNKAFGKQPQVDRHRSRSGVSKARRPPSKQPESSRSRPQSRQPPQQNDRPRSNNGRLQTKPGTLYDKPVAGTWRPKQVAVTVTPTETANCFAALEDLTSNAETAPLEVDQVEAATGDTDQENTLEVSASNTETDPPKVVQEETDMGNSSKENVDTHPPLGNSIVAIIPSEEIVNVEFLVDVNMHDPISLWTNKTNVSSEVISQDKPGETSAMEEDNQYREEERDEEPTWEDMANLPNIVVALPASVNAELFEEATRAPNKKERKKQAREKRQQEQASASRVTRSKSNPPSQKDVRGCPQHNNHSK